MCQSRTPDLSALTQSRVNTACIAFSALQLCRCTALPDSKTARTRFCNGAQVADPRLARLSAAAEDEGIAAPRIVSRRQARGELEEESDGGVAESSEESEEEDEEVTARRMAVRERQVLLMRLFPPFSGAVH